MKETLLAVLIFAIITFLVPYMGIVIADIIDATDKKVLLKKIKRFPSEIKDLWKSLFEDGE